VWEKVPFSQGAWVGQYGGAYFSGPYRAFSEPDDRIYFAGDFCSHVLVWQEGAALSAHRTVSMIGQRVRAAKA